MNSGASEAAFSSDGKTLWAISREGDALLRFQTDDGAKAPQPIKLPEAIDQDGGPMQLQTDPKGLLIAGAAKLWLWNPAEPKVAPKALATFPPQFEVSGMVRTPGKGNEGAILISGYHSFSDEHPKPKDFDETESLYRLAAGKKSFVPVFVRRLERVTAAPAFSGERMVFGGSYDVWEGGVEVEEPSEMPPTLWGQRIAPLAMCNTDGANSGSMGVHQVTIAGDTVWATMRGHLMGSVVSFPLPKKIAEAEAPDLTETWKIQRDSLSQAKAVKFPAEEGVEASDMTDSADALCSTTDVDGNWKIAFRTNHRNFWVLTKGAKGPVPIGTETSEEAQ